MRRREVSWAGGLRRELAGTGRAVAQRDGDRHNGAAGEDRREADHRGLHGEVPQGDAEQDGGQAHPQVRDDEEHGEDPRA
ncbi:hypothetical protein [Streptomyces echinatus]|uniref:Uncharacterized protein n=1 Tax=Streptomyces echinatus TaxID=67293 RepID=A0A7W9UNS7_9ACTN|nr:hypothetical protein [Streptomyces echinatus]MBB5925608.1 hypothetical protein [Streptomyces echinatus]